VNTLNRLQQVGHWSAAQVRHFGHQWAGQCPTH
jgi:hypothetical protein